MRRLPRRRPRCCVPSRAGRVRWPRGARTSESLHPAHVLESENEEPSLATMASFADAPSLCNRQWNLRAQFVCDIRTSRSHRLRDTLELTMVFVLDNYDSFTYNLVQYLGELGAKVVVRRNDELTVEEVEAMHPDRILLSPGPCTPGEAGILVPLIRHMAGKAPILGVCLGHQAIGEAFGGLVVRASHLMHGKTSRVEHDGKGIFAGLSTPLTCTRYHSLIVREKSLPASLIITARTEENNGAGKATESVIMGLRHRDLPIEGVQFHPESVLTEGGHQMIRNFLDM